MGTHAVDHRPRLLVLTDITSATTGVREPDDAQSMVRLMLYSNAFRIEGLIASSNLRHGQTVRPELIHGIIDAYAGVYQNLAMHAEGYPDPGELHALVMAGQPVAGPGVDVWDSIGEGRDTEASRHIIRVVDNPDDHPVWVMVWGGTADLAQALYKVRKERGEAGAGEFVKRLRVHAIGDQDSTGPWIRAGFHGLYYVKRSFGYRGMYRGGDLSLSSDAWVAENVTEGHGCLGAAYPNYSGGDIWSHRLGAVKGVKEGDSPSYLGLVPNGLNIPGHPEWGGWGGRLAYDGQTDCLTDAHPPEGMGDPNDPDPRMVEVYRWRPAYQADFAARLDWCVNPPGGANHAPIAGVAVDGGVETGSPGYKWIGLDTCAGDTVVLDASSSVDPDCDALSFRWTIDPPGHPLPEADCDGAVLRFRVPDTAVPGDTHHLLLTVTDSGEPPLSSWKRVVVTVVPKERINKTTK